MGPSGTTLREKWRIIHNVDRYVSVSLPNIIRVIGSRILRWEGHVARMGERREAYKVLVGISKGKRPLGRTRRRWEDNIKMDLLTVTWGGKD